MSQTCLQIKNLGKNFTMHHQNAVTLNVIDDISFDVHSGECVVLQGESGQGKSTLLRCLYSNYLTTKGSITFNDSETGRVVDLMRASPQQIMQLRREKIAYVSQFLRVIPRISALEVVSQPMRDVGYSADQIEKRAKELLTRLRIPQRLWDLSPTSFSGGEQQRINIAREFSIFRPLMLLDEPTASLDELNRETVLDLIDEAKQQGAAIVAIFHDRYSRDRLADRTFDISRGEML